MDFMASQLLVYEKKGDSAVILRCFSRGGYLDIPERINGQPVRELAPYAFSAHLDENALREALREGRAQIISCENPAALISYEEGLLAGIPALGGERLEEIRLPLTLRRVGRYCFYDCAHLRKIEFSGELFDWGSGAFSGCHQVEQLCVHVEPDGGSGLKQVLDELPESLCVELSDHTSPTAEITREKAAYARLAFPEFYEEGVENTPARILETHVHGTGILYRNCFQGKKFDFTQYDSLFPYAQAQENSELLISLVLGRLRCPYRLEPQAQKRYEAYLHKNAVLFGKQFLDETDPEGLQWFLERYVAQQTDFAKSALLDRLLEHAARLKDAQSISRLMVFQRQALPASGRRKRLEL